MFETILFEKENGIATITLNRPSVLNAMNYQMWRELENAVIMCEEDPEVRVVVLKGAGRAFCTGDDFIGGTNVPEWWDGTSDIIVRIHTATTNNEPVAIPSYASTSPVGSILCKQSLPWLYQPLSPSVLQKHQDR